MKKTNNTRKISKMISFLMIFSLLSFNAFTQKSFNNNTLNEIKASLYLDSKADIIEAFSLPYDCEFSEEVMIEDWMNYPSEWSDKSESALLAIPESLNEEQVEIENWMTEPDWNIIVVEEIQIENWMTTPGSWNVKNELVGIESRYFQSSNCTKN